MVWPDLAAASREANSSAARRFPTKTHKTTPGAINDLINVIVIAHTPGRRKCCHHRAMGDSNVRESSDLDCPLNPVANRDFRAGRILQAAHVRDEIGQL